MYNTRLSKAKQSKQEKRREKRIDYSHPRLFYLCFFPFCLAKKNNFAAWPICLLCPPGPVRLAASAPIPSQRAAAPWARKGGQSGVAFLASSHRRPHFFPLPKACAAPFFGIDAHTHQIITHIGTLK